MTSFLKSGCVRFKYSLLTQSNGLVGVYGIKIVVKKKAAGFCSLVKKIKTMLIQ